MLNSKATAHADLTACKDLLAWDYLSKDMADSLAYLTGTQDHCKKDNDSGLHCKATGGHARSYSNRL